MKKALKIVGLALLVLTIAMPVFAGGGRQAAGGGDVVRIGVFQPLTGANAAGGILELRGTQLAHELFPYVYVYGRRHRVELFINDNRSDRVEAPLVMGRMIDSDRVHIVIGT